MKALVTGAAGFIGASLSGALLRRGYNVIGIDNLNDYYDVSLKEARLKLLRCKPNFQFQKLDIFVGNHGIWPPQDEPVATLSNDRWNRTIDANLNSIFYTCRAAASRLNQHGRIVLVSSTAAQRGEAAKRETAAGPWKRPRCCLRNRTNACPWLNTASKNLKKSEPSIIKKS